MTAIREQLVAAILTATGGAYGLPSPEDERDLPVTLVQDGTDSATNSYDTTSLTMPLNVARAELAVGTDTDVLRAQAHAALAKLITDMHADETFGGLADGVDYTGGGIQIEVGKFVFAEGTFSVRYHHLRGQPSVLE